MKNKQNRSVWFIVVLIVIVLCVVGFFICKKSSQSTESMLTPDQIFQESSSQLGFTRQQVIYFRIFGQDKIQYSFGSGTSFAYKIGGTWHLIGKGKWTDVPECSEIAPVPEQYNPGCFTAATQKTSYIDEHGSSINYPYKDGVSYIGE